MLAEDLVKILDAVAPRATFKAYDQAWRINGRLLQVEKRDRKFRICTFWPTTHRSNWLIPETTLKRLSEMVPSIAAKLADPAVDFSKDK
jgi:hypothetical protein